MRSSRGVSGRTRLKIVTVLVAVIAVAYAARDALPVEATAESVREFVHGIGWWGPPVFVSLFAFRFILLLPSVVLLAAGGICFGIFGGTIFGALGLTLSAALKWVIAHVAGREAVLARVPERLRRRLALVDRRSGAAALGVVTAFPVGPAETLHIGAVLAGMQAVPFFLAVIGGSLVRAGSLSVFGDSLAEGDRLTLAIAVVTLTAATAAGVLWLRRRRQPHSITNR
jgi:uncharacterized membrane protein YdjX (TVP38/TMEM64 family)